MKILVIGNGIGGFRAASTIRQLSREYDITIVSKETVPLYSPCVLPDYISDKISREQTFVKKEEAYKKLGFNTLFGIEVREIDAAAKKVIVDSGKSHSFDKLILALGSNAVTFGKSKKGIFKLKTLQDADNILKHKGKNAVVVGSGAIGIEVAIALHHRGYQVTVIEMVERILPLGLDKKGASRVKEILQNFGIEVSNGERAIEVVGQDHIKGLLTDKRRLPCDTLVWAIGMRPNTDLAKKAGIELGAKGGIRVNSRMETNIKDIYACGDCVETNDILTGCASLNLFWHNANRQGAVAGHNCVGVEANYQGSENILNLDVFGNHIAGFGQTEASISETRSHGKIDMREDGISVIENDRNGGYYRLVIFGDRCVGGQFINMHKDIGLIWSIMVRRRSIKKLLQLFKNEEVLDRRPWHQRIKLYFQQ